MELIRPPVPALRPYVQCLWYKEIGPMGCRREWVLPTGSMHLAFRLAVEPVRLYRSQTDTQGRVLAGVVVGGARCSPFLKHLAGPARSLGAMLSPGAAAALLGCRADRLAERHLPLSALWGEEALRLDQRLRGVRSGEEGLAWIEAALLGRLPRLRGLHPAVAAALERLADGEQVALARAGSGYSERGFIDLFRREVGLPPKRYGRVLRLQQALVCWRERPTRPLADLALATGYSDQAHFQREFRLLTGLTPGAFRALSPDLSHHVPLRSDSFKPAAADLP